MTPRRRAIRLANEIARLPVEERCNVLLHILDGRPIPPESNDERDAVVLQIRRTWLGALKDEPAAKKLEQAVTRYAAGEFASHADVEDVPKELRGTMRADLWRLLKLGPPLGFERYRQIFRIGNAQPIEITSDRAH